MTVRDFSQIFDAYSKFEEDLINKKMVFLRTNSFPFFALFLILIYFLFLFFFLRAVPKLEKLMWFYNIGPNGRGS